MLKSYFCTSFNSWTWKHTNFEYENRFYFFCESKNLIIENGVKTECRINFGTQLMRWNNKNIEKSCAFLLFTGHHALLQSVPIFADVTNSLPYQISKTDALLGFRQFTPKQ